MKMSKLLRNSERGSSLIEVLIALFVLAIGLLGVLSMQANAVKLSRSSAEFSSAEILLVNMYESMLSTPANRLGNYQINFSEPAPTLPGCASATPPDCDEVDMVNWNLANWFSSIESDLPGGDGEIIRDPTSGEFTIRISFIAGYDESGSSIEEVVSLDGNFGT